MKVLLTSGGTKTAIDEVRYVGNMSKGTFGCHICETLLESSHNVTFLYAKDSKCPHKISINLNTTSKKEAFNIIENRKNMLSFIKKNYSPIEYNDFDDYELKLEYCLTKNQYDVVILAAAVSDFKPIKSEGKISSDLNELNIKMQATPKLIKEVKGFQPDTMLVGFKLLVGSNNEQLIAAMKKQALSTGADLVVGNDLRDIRSNNHSLTIYMHNPTIRTNGEICSEGFNNLSGSMLAKKLVLTIEESLYLKGKN
jgi:phosphopantothenoylcysteine synthetase/decarboxylase